ncbi:MAG: 50S ribosomal protein L17 [Pirellulaceae bacterium]|nr:50S ribosomal protein L17 [Pirellulaceae bacterium]
MRHKRLGRRLGRSSSHRKAMFANMACSLFLTERDPEMYEGLYQSDGKTPVKPPQFKGRIVTTLPKAKELRPIVERLITMAKKALPYEEAAREFATDADRNTSEWKAWRESDRWQKWVAARAPAVALRRRVFAILRQKEAVKLLFDEIAPKMADRNGGYTRILKLATPRLGDAGDRAILELVGRFDRSAKASVKPSFDNEGDLADE